jgi:hypothetical protein
MDEDEGKHAPKVDQTVKFSAAGRPSIEKWSECTPWLHRDARADPECLNHHHCNATCMFYPGNPQHHQISPLSQTKPPNSPPVGPGTRQAKYSPHPHCSVAVFAFEPPNSSPALRGPTLTSLAKPSSNPLGTPRNPYLSTVHLRRHWPFSLKYDPTYSSLPHHLSSLSYIVSLSRSNCFKTSRIGS